MVGLHAVTGTARPVGLVMLVTWPALSGALMALAFPWWPHIVTEPLAWFGLVPMLALLDRLVASSARPRAYVAAAVLHAAAYQLGCIGLLIAVKGPLVFWLMVQVPWLALPWLLYAGLRRWYGRTVALVCLPLLWAGLEWIYSTHLPPQLPWWVMGASQARMTWLIQGIDLTGVWGLSGWLVAVNAALWALLAHAPWAHATAAPLRAGSGCPAKSWLQTPPLWTLALLAALPLGYAAWHLPPASEVTEISAEPSEPTVPAASGEQTTAPGNPSLQVLAIAPGADRIAEDAATLAALLAQTDTALRAAPQRPDLILWPEAAAQLPVVQHLPTRNAVLAHVQRWGVPLLLVGIEHGEPHPTHAHNPEALPWQAEPRYLASSLYTPELAQWALHSAPDAPLPIATDRKQRLTPFGEYLPLMQAWDAWARWYAERFPEHGNNWYTPGEGQAVAFKLRTQPRNPSPPETHNKAAGTAGTSVHAVGAITCFELLFPTEVAQRAQAGAQALAWLTNDAQAEGSAYIYQFAQFARLRAVENRRAIVRANLDGDAFVADAYGRTTPFSGRTGHPAASLHTLPLHTAITWYTRHPDWFPLASLAAAGLITAMAWLLGTIRRRRTGQGLAVLPERGTRRERDMLIN